MRVDRRAFLAQLSALSAGLATGALAPGCRRRPPAAMPTFAAEQRTALDALCAHLLPSDDGPGADEAGCSDFIARELAKPEFNLLRAVAESGLQALDAAAQRIAAARFADLTTAQREQVLAEVRALRRRGLDGDRFVHLMLVLVIEGFLSDPRHGGNRNGVGWQYVGFKPVRWAPGDDRAWRN
ncbi:MAG: gluconate 2-dehydrogenase subunit 3 family protein [Deltaproteobacteria bacterium]|nr:gluconate 2-dehydrogenase subunit 3 family protein [Deltaproteobacteria bacterium]